MNDGGCWCDDQYGSQGSFKRVADVECFGGRYGAEGCGAGPCGSKKTHNAVYKVAAAPKGEVGAADDARGNLLARVRVDLGVGFTGTWVFRARSTAFMWTLAVSTFHGGHVVVSKVGGAPHVDSP